MWQKMFCSLQLMRSSWASKEWYLKSRGRRKSGNLKAFLKSKNPHLKSDFFYLVKVPKVYLVEDRTRWNHEFPVCSKVWSFKNLLCFHLGSPSMHILYWYILAPPTEMESAPKSPWLIWRPSSDCSQLVCPAALFPISWAYRELHGLVRHQSSFKWTCGPPPGRRVSKVPSFFQK